MVPRHVHPPYGPQASSPASSRLPSRPQALNDPERTKAPSPAHSAYSDEADDERSSLSSLVMGPDAHDSDSDSNDSDSYDGEAAFAASYPGEDTRPTSKRELAGFYMYGWAAEVFVVCGMGSFIPIALEQLARERGVLRSDHSTPCSPSFNATSPTRTAGSLKGKEQEQCVVYILGTEVNTASFAMYTFSVSVAVQTLLILSMSGAADHGQYRKTLLLTFAVIGSVATMLFLPVTPNVFMLGSLLAVIANTCFGASSVLLNSFLPLLVRNHPSLRMDGPIRSGDFDRDAQAYREGDEETGDDDPSATLLPSPDGADAVLASSAYRAPTTEELALSTRISANGIGIGYLAGVIVQLFAIGIVISLDAPASTFPLRVVLFIAGAWWLLFTIPAGLWLRARPGPPLTSISSSTGTARTWLAYLTYSWASLARTVSHARRLRDIAVFLTAWLLISDAVATISGTAILFAKTTLAMEAPALALMNVIVILCGILGAFAWSRLSSRVGLSPPQTILACMCLFELVPLYALLGYIPAIRRWGVFGLQQPWEVYPVGAVYGLVLGGLGSFCRSVYGELIPEGFEAAFYALYAITDKGSSMFGPAVVGVIIDRTGEVRMAFWFLAVLVGLPIPLMRLVDVERGRRDGMALSLELNKSTKLGGPSSNGGYGTMPSDGRDVDDGL